MAGDGRARAHALGWGKLDFPSGLRPPPANHTIPHESYECCKNQRYGAGARTNRTGTAPQGLGKQKSEAHKGRGSLLLPTPPTCAVPLCTVPSLLDDCCHIVVAPP